MAWSLRTGRLLAFGLAAVAVSGAAGCGVRDKVPSAWGLGVHSFDARQLGLVGDTPAPVHPALVDMTDHLHLSVPTYEGSHQVVHPDAMVDPNDPNGRLLMAITPYPDSNGRVENPSMYQSRDGAEFRPIDGLSNPLVQPPAIDHNDDPDLRWDPVAGEYEMLYLETERPIKQTLVSLRTTDLVNWRRTDPIKWDLTAGDDFIVSPTAVFDGTKTWMFYVNLSTAVFAQRLQFLTSADGKTWDFSKKQSVAIDITDFTPWHIDIVQGPAGYALLISGYPRDFFHQNLYVATSKDLVTWTLQPEPLIAYADHAFGIESAYRSTALVDGDKLWVWYSMRHRHRDLDEWTVSDDQDPRADDMSADEREPLVDP